MADRKTAQPGVPTALGPIHHIGVVVEDIDQAVETYRQLGFQPHNRVRIEDQRVDVVPLQAAESWIELLAPLDRESGIGRYLEARGQGIHHVAYLVDDVASTLAELERSGVELIDREPHVGLHGWVVAFIHPRSCAGVLTELVERGSTI